MEIILLAILDLATTIPNLATGVTSLPWNFAVK